MLFELIRDRLSECINILPEGIETNTAKTDEWATNLQSIRDRIDSTCHKEIPEIREEIDVLFRNIYGIDKY